MKRILLLISIFLILFHTQAFAQTRVIEGKVSEQSPATQLEQGVSKTKIIKSGVSKELHKNLDVQVLNVKFYYHPDADAFYELLKDKGQRQYPHLMGYKEIEGLYRKALSESQSEAELTKWVYQGGPTPYFINAGAEIRNNGSAAFTDVKLTFTFEAKVATLRASPSTLTTNYQNLERNARWQTWLTKTINIKILPPGEYTVIHTEDISLCALLEKLNQKWPESIRVKVYAYSPMDSVKSNNYATKNIQLIPNHFVMKTLH